MLLLSIIILNAISSQLLRSRFGPGVFIDTENRNCMGRVTFHYTIISDCHDDVIKWKHFPRYCPLCGELTGHRWIPLTKASDAELWVFFDLRLNKRLNKQSWGWWFETPWRSLWRHCNGLTMWHQTGDGSSLDTLTSSQNGRHFANNIFKSIFLPKLNDFSFMFHLILFCSQASNWLKTLAGSGEACRREVTKPLPESMLA